MPSSFSKSSPILIRRLSSPGLLRSISICGGAQTCTIWPLQLPINFLIKKNRIDIRCFTTQRERETSTHTHTVIISCCSIPIRHGAYSMTPHTTSLYDLRTNLNKICNRIFKKRKRVCECVICRVSNFRPTGYSEIKKFFYF